MRDAVCGGGAGVGAYCDYVVDGRAAVGCVSAEADGYVLVAVDINAVAGRRSLAPSTVLSRPMALLRKPVDAVDGCADHLAFVVGHRVVVAGDRVEVPRNIVVVAGHLVADADYSVRVAATKLFEPVT